MSSSKSDPLGYAHAERARYYAELDEFLRIPSVSAKSDHDADTERAAIGCAPAGRRRTGSGDAADPPDIR